MNTPYRPHRNALAMLQVGRLRARGLEDEANSIVAALCFYNRAVDEEEIGDFIDSTNILCVRLRLAREAIREHDARTTA